MTFYHLDRNLSYECFVSTLRSEKDFRESLDTWNHFPKKAEERWQEELEETIHDHERDYIDSHKNPKTNQLAQAIIRRWREVDEESFLESEFVGWERGEE